MNIYCCACTEKVKARLTNGCEVYPSRPDLASLPFWLCGTCNNFVGCHHKTKNRTNPLGCIATKEIRQARMHIHSILDPIWKSGKMCRRDLYNLITEKTGRSYHTSNIRSIEEAREIYRIIRSIARNLN